MDEISITEGHLQLKDGTLTLKISAEAGRIPVMPRHSDDLECGTNKNNKEKAKTSSERQKDFYDKMKSNGWKKIWVDPATLDLAAELGGIEKVSEDRAQWIKRASSRRRFWGSWFRHAD